MRMTQSFSTFARLPAPRFQPVALRALLAEVCALYAGTSPVPVELRARRRSSSSARTRTACAASSATW